MTELTTKILFELQPKRKPNFLNFVCSYKSIIVFIAFYYLKSLNFTLAFLLLIGYFYVELGRTMLTYSMKISDKKNLRYFLNILAKRYYKGNDNLEFKEILSNKVLNPKDIKK